MNERNRTSARKNKSYLLKALEGYLLAWIAVVAIMHFLAQSLQWLAPLGLALLSFGYAAYHARSHPEVRTGIAGQASIFVAFGFISLLCALILAIRPVPEPGLALAPGYLAGIFIGIGIFWLIAGKLSVKGG